MSKNPGAELGKRERQIMEIVYRRGRASASDVLADLPHPPTYSTVRGMLRYLEDKGQLRHEQEGTRYVYFPATPANEVRGSALSHVVRTFFGGSVTTAVAALLEAKSITRSEHQRLSRLLDGAVEDRET